MIKCINSRLIAVLHNVIAKLSTFVHTKYLRFRFDAGTLVCFIIPGAF